MSNSSTDSSEHGQVVRAGRWRGFLFVATLAQVVAILGCPTIVVPPRISSQLVRVGVAIVVCATPLVASLVLLFRQRDLSERVIAWSSLAFSLFWIVFAGWLVEQALRGP